MSDFNSVEKGPIVDVAAVVEVDRLLDGTRIQAREAAEELS